MLDFVYGYPHSNTFQTGSSASRIKLQVIQRNAHRRIFCRNFSAACSRIDITFPFYISTNQVKSEIGILEYLLTYEKAPCLITRLSMQTFSVLQTSLKINENLRTQTETFPSQKQKLQRSLLNNY